MSDRKFYYLSEIIIGLRDEYNNLKNELDELKKTMVVLDNYDASFGFDLSNPERRVLIVKLEKKVKGLEKLINIIKASKSFDTEISCDAIYNNPELQHASNFVRETNWFNYNDKYKTIIYKECDKILHEDIVLGGFSTPIEVKDSNMEIKIAPNCIDLYANKFNKLAPFTGIAYRAFEDELVINNYSNNPSFAAGITEIMHTPIPKSIINSRVTKIIDNNPKSLLPLKIKGLTNTKATQYFSLEEKEDSVVATLTRTKM